MTFKEAIQFLEIPEDEEKEIEEYFKSQIKKLNIILIFQIMK